MTWATLLDENRAHGVYLCNNNHTSNYMIGRNLRTIKALFSSWVWKRPCPNLEVVSMNFRLIFSRERRLDWTTRDCKKRTKCQCCNNHWNLTRNCKVNGHFHNFVTWQWHNATHKYIAGSNNKPNRNLQNVYLIGGIRRKAAFSAQNVRLCQMTSSSHAKRNAQQICRFSLQFCLF